MYAHSLQIRKLKNNDDSESSIGKEFAEENVSRR
jgi:hypothetical protein